VRHEPLIEESSPLAKGEERREDERSPPHALIPREDESAEVEEKKKLSYLYYSRSGKEEGASRTEGFSVHTVNRIRGEKAPCLILQ